MIHNFFRKVGDNLEIFRRNISCKTDRHKAEQLCIDRFQQACRQAVKRKPADIQKACSIFTGTVRKHFHTDKNRQRLKQPGQKPDGQTVTGVTQLFKL